MVSKEGIPLKSEAVSATVSSIYKGISVTVEKMGRLEIKPAASQETCH